MNLEDWDLANISDLTPFYNRQIEPLPYCYPVSVEEFDWGVRYDRYKNETHHLDRLHSHQVIVSKQGGEVVGFAHISIENDEDTGKQNGVIRFLSYVPGNREVGQTLLDEAESRFRAAEIGRIYAFLTPYVYRFYFLGYGVTEQQGHVTGLLGMNGYEIDRGEILMVWPHFEVTEPVLKDSSVEIQVQPFDGYGMLPGLEVYAFRNGERFAQCQNFSVGHRMRAAEAQDQTFMRWMGVNDSVHGQGWGRYLLQRALWEEQQLGYKHALISASTRNHAALLFYTNYGYRVTDTWYEYVKGWEDDS